jgi:hypothetical protein
MTRARVKAIQHEVNSLLSTYDLDNPLDGLLLNANTIYVIRCIVQELHPWNQANGREEDDEMSSQQQGMYYRPHAPVLPPQASTAVKEVAQKIHSQNFRRSHRYYRPSFDKRSFARSNLLWPRYPFPELG